jgi:hypothetical protein
VAQAGWASKAAKISALLVAARPPESRRPPKVRIVLRMVAALFPNRHSSGAGPRTQQEIETESRTWNELFT